MGMNALPVLCGRLAGVFSECSGEVVDVRHAAVLGDGLYLHVGGVEQKNRIIHPARLT